MSNRTVASEGLALLEQLSPNQRRELHRKASAIDGFSRGLLGIQLRPYQVEAAEAVVKSVFARDGKTFVIIFPRQSGKDELLADLILYLLARLAEKGASMICAQPTFRPQTLNAIDRLESRAAQRPFFEQGGFRRKHGHIFCFGSSRITYLSADPSASVVGATASRLLMMNEAQDIQTGIYDKRFAPMAASGNATRVFSGTAWTGDTLLDREKRLALQLEKQDGLRRLFIVDGDQVACANALYARFLENELRRLGRDHPLIRTQYFCENIDARAGMFTPAHRALMSCPAPSPLGQLPSPNSFPAFGDRGASCKEGPGVGPIVNRKSEIKNALAFLLDVAGQEESHMSSAQMSDAAFDFDSNYSRDAVTLRIVEIDLSTLETLQAPTYRAVHLQQWTGQNHITIFGQLKALAETWRPQHIVIDATGVGEGLWAMLDKAFPTRVIPVKFTQAVKSQLGYGFLAIINTGRFRDCVPCAETDKQYAACECEVLIGPTKTMRWGVPDGRRDADGRPIHDDIPVTDSLTAILDDLEWTITFPSYFIPAPDPLDDIDRLYRRRYANDPSSRRGNN